MKRRQAYRNERENALIENMASAKRNRSEEAHHGSISVKKLAERHRKHINQ
jgi:hypothetical protein